MKIVIDTNVIENALFRRDRWAREIMLKIAHGHVSGLVSIPIVDEYSFRFSSVLSTCPLPAETLQPVIKAFARFLVTLERIEVTSKESFSPDPDDDKFFNCAIDGGADFIISQDGDDMHSVCDPRFKVLSPWQFCRRRS